MLNKAIVIICDTKQKRMMQIVLRLVVGLFFVTLIALGSTTSWASNASDANTIVVKAELTAEGFDLDPNIYPSWRELLKDAKAIFIIPQIIKGGFLFGGSGGSGVLLARNKSGGWNGPAFYTIAGISFGLLAGAQVAETIIVVRTERGLNRLLNTSVKLGADVSVAAGPVGSGIGSANIIADLVVLSRSKGLYGGLSLDGSVVSVRGALDRAYYRSSVSPTDILIRGSARNPQADGLIAAVKKLIGSK